VFIPFGVKYRVGQPIGFYSSWPAFAMSIHILVEYCAAEEGFKTFRNYVVLGDDVAIFNQKVYNRFLIECETLGLGVNLNKSTRRRSCAEFARRLYFRKGGKVRELTGIPVTHMKTLARKPYTLTDIVGLIVQRGYSLKSTFINVQTLLGTLPISKKRKADAVLHLLFNIKLNVSSPVYNPLLSEEILLREVGTALAGKIPGWLRYDDFLAYKRDIILLKVIELIEESVQLTTPGSTVSHNPDFGEMHPLILASGIA